MPAISSPKRTMYGGNFCRQGPNMLAITEIVPEARDYDFLTKTTFQCLQVYLVPIQRDCKHIWSVLDLRSHTY